NKELQKIAFSATLHEMLLNQISIFFKNTKIINVSENIWTNKKIVHNLIHMQINYDKQKALDELIVNINPYFCMIFCNTIKEAELIYKHLFDKQLNVALLHGKLESRQRKNVYKAILNFNYQYLVATDLASRGLDIDGASHIISFDLPKEDFWYIHRAGRSGRGKYSGTSYVFFDQKYLANINRLKNKGIDWNHFKLNKGNLVPIKYVIKSRRKKEVTEVDKQIQFILNTADKKVKPGYKKKLKQEIKKVKQKAKRKKIDQSVKDVLIIKYKKASAEKTRIKKFNEAAEKKSKSNHKKKYYKK
ncbi:MAG: helicase-related protein, partial [Mycoplasmoidaceae bacterium]